MLMRADIPILIRIFTRCHRIKIAIFFGVWRTGSYIFPVRTTYKSIFKKRRTRCVTEIILLRLVGNRMDDLYRLVSNAVEEGG